jgi:hypothetical protein
MRTRTTRSFRISDALVLVAATALGLAGCRFWLWVDAQRSKLWPTGAQPVLRTVWLTAVGMIPVCSILLLSWTTAVFFLRLRSPRPRRRLLWCQPGFLACVAVVFVSVWKSIGVGLLAAAQLWAASTGQLLNINSGELAKELALMLLIDPFPPQFNIGAAVVLLWLVTCAGGRCRPEPSWVDRSGRALGALWICTALLETSVLLLG